VKCTTSCHGTLDSCTLRLEYLAVQLDVKEVRTLGRESTRVLNKLCVEVGQKAKIKRRCYTRDVDHSEELID
jgi:hypothetical protein